MNDERHNNMTSNDYKNWNVSDWEATPIDRICDLLRDRPQLVASCPDTVWRKFRLGHWAKLIREPSKNSSCPVIASHEGRLGVVNKMKELGVAVGVAGSNDAVVVGGFEWCCLFHWANEYGSVFVKLPLRAAAAAAVCAENVAHGQKVDQRVKFIAENSAMNPRGGALGHGSRFASEIPKHIQWLAALAADFAAMSAEAAVSAPEYAEEYSLIAQAAAYEIKVLTPDDVSSARAQDVCRN